VPANHGHQMENPSVPFHPTLQIRSGQRTQGRIQVLCSRLLHLDVRQALDIDSGKHLLDFIDSSS
jgi:hypothetical protein